MALKSMFLIVLAVLFLVLPGMLYNNLNANGLVVSQSQSLTCSTNSQNPTCVISGNVGCQASASYCTLSGSSISFLSHTSIFTSLLSGNIFGVWGSLNNQGSQTLHGPYDLMGGINVAQINANCVVTGTGAKVGLQQWGFRSCTMAESDTANATLARSTSWHDWNTKLQATDSALSFYQLIGNGTKTLDCAWNFQLNITTGGRSTGFTWYGCDFYGGAGGTGVLSNPWWSFWLAVPYEITGCTTGGSDNSCHAASLTSGYACSGGITCYHENVQVALVLWEAKFCSATAQGDRSGARPYYVSQPCNLFWQSLNNNVQTAGSNSMSFGLLTPLILFVIGLILFIIGLGVNFGFGGSVLGSGTQGSIGANEQGSRLAQTIGLGLIIWVPLYSEFSTWFTSGLLPYGLDGAAGIMAIIITGLFFVGLFWRMLERQ